MLLFSALYLTIMVIFIKPAEGYTLFGYTFPAWFDPRIAIGVYPILSLMILTVPDALAPMIYTLSVEEFWDKACTKKVMQEMKLAQFAAAAKLLQGMRSKTRAAKKREEASQSVRAEQSVEEFLRSLPEEKRKRGLELKQVFEAFDTGGEADGQLDLRELGELMKSMGTSLEKAELLQLVEELDSNGDGAVSFVEFASHMLTDEEDESAEEVAEAIFDMMDADGSGNLTMAEIKAAFASLHTGLSDDDISEIVSRMDADDSGDVDRAEFVQLLTEILEAA